MGTLFGPLLGAAALHALSEVTREVIGDVPGISLVLYGVLLVIMVLFMPRGIASIAHLRRRKRVPAAAPKSASDAPEARHA
jgi:branched-chain amino acid transport system permease protein